MTNWQHLQQQIQSMTPDQFLKLVHQIRDGCDECIYCNYRDEGRGCIEDCDEGQFAWLNMEKEPDCKEIEFPIKKYRVIMKCQCGGNLEATGKINFNDPARTCEHVCTKCGTVKFFDISYPFTRYEEIKHETNR